MEDKTARRARLAALVDGGTAGEGGSWAAFDGSDGINLLTQLLLDGWFDLALRLLARGYDVETPNLCGTSPLRAACATGRATAAAFLIGAGAAVDGRDEDDESPLSDAARKDDLEMVRFLISCGAAVRLKRHPWSAGWYSISGPMRACLKDAGWVEGE